MTTGTKNVLASLFSISHEGMNTLNTDTIYPITNSIYASRRRTKFKVSMFHSSSKKKLKTIRVVRASLAMDFLHEEVKVEASSILKVTATVIVKISNDMDVVNAMVKLPWFYGSVEKGIGFQLVSTELDPRAMKPKLSKESVLDWSKSTTLKANGTRSFNFKVELVIDADFGEPGAILVRNNYDKELYLETISVEGFFHFSCNSWIQPAHTSKGKRIFFANKAYLPSQTPKGLKYLRAKELKYIRGDGNGLKLPSDRIYDYDTYNDLGSPDKRAELARPTLGVPDDTKPHGLRLLIEDYPYANDGLLIWSAIEELVHTYVDHYYPNENAVISDTELQSWYNEAVNVGHADLREAKWWPKLATRDNLTEILTILIWISSAQHAALNFGQYQYGGYVPNRPPLMQKLIPQQHDLEYASFIADPEGYFLASLPSLFQLTKYMAVIDMISAHSHDEEYLGDTKDVCTNWQGDPKIIEAFYRFSMKVKRIENVIRKRNVDPRLRNRCGAGVPPYELLVPSSEPGVTGRGVPNSITI